MSDIKEEVSSEQEEINESVKQEDSTTTEEQENNESETQEDSSTSADAAQEEGDKNSKEEDAQEEKFSNAKESSNGTYDTLELTKEITRLETQVEGINSTKPDIKQFHQNINDYLTDDEKQLLFEEDKSEYFAAVEKAKEKFMEETAGDTKEQEGQIKNLKQKLAVSSAIDSIVANPEYKDFNFTKLQKFWNEDLTGAERKKLDTGSTAENVQEHLLNVYKAYKKKNPIKIKSSNNPNIPDASKVSKTSISDKNEIAQKEKDEKHRAAIGFRVL